MWIAEAAGLYSKYNLRIEHVYIPGGSVIIQAMLSGDVKVANMAPVSAITAWTKGADLALVATHVTRSELTLVTTAKLSKLEDLKGKRIGISRFGSITDVALREALRFYQLNPERDVVILQTGSQGARLASLKAGSLDAAVLPGEARHEAEKLGLRVMIDLSELPMDYPINGMVIRRDFGRTNRDALKRFLMAWCEGIKIFKTDKLFTLQVLRKHLNVEDEALNRIYSFYLPLFRATPFPDRKGVAFALKQLTDSSPEVAKFNANDFVVSDIVSELESDGFYKHLYKNKTSQ